jgi:hypothetical protein
MTEKGALNMKKFDGSGPPDLSFALIQEQNVG